MTWLEGPQKAEEFGENNEFGESDQDKSDEITSPRLLAKLYKWVDQRKWWIRREW